MAEARRDALDVPDPPDEAALADTVPHAVVPDDRDGRRGLHVRLFGSHMFFRLWLTQVVSATGDWLGFVAIAALATRVGAGSPAAAVGVVMSARLVPGFFLSPVAGVLVDRWDRKRVMVTCDVGRAVVLVLLPFVDSVAGLVLASLVLEVLTLMWAPAKEASVPHLVPTNHLTTANSLSLVAAYGTIPLAGAMFSILAKVAEWLGHIEALHRLRLDQTGLAFYVDGVTFLISAVMISTLALPHRRNDGEVEGKKVAFGRAVQEIKEGWRFIFINPVVRAVNVGLACGLIGGAMVVPLGPVFSQQVVGAGDAGFGLFIFALGMGVAAGVVTLSALQARIPKLRVFTVSVFVAGASLGLAASMSTLLPAAFLVGVLGVCAGSVYVLGFTLLHEHVADELRGRIFSALYTLVRFCVLLAFAVGPFLSELLGRLSDDLVDGRVRVLGLEVAVPGVRLTLWMASLIIFGAGVLAVLSLRTVPETATDTEAPA
jgi:dTMP kinase